jgi:hypothetical protein
MKIQSVPAPQAPSATPTSPAIQAQMRTSNKATPGSAKERAIAKFLAGTAAAAEAPPSPAQEAAAVEQTEAAIESPEVNQNDIGEEAPAEPTETVETAPEATEAAPKADELKVTPAPLSQQYAILARKDKALRQREQQLKAREAALQQAAPAKQEAPAPSNQFDPSKFVSKDMLQKNPFGVLNELGLSYDKLVDIVTNGPSHEQISSQMELQMLKEELRAIKAETENTKKSFETSQQEQNQQALNMMKKEAAKLVASDESFEMLKLRPDAIEDVVKLIERTYEEDGEFLSVAEAASQIEELLAEEAMKYARAKKIQSRLVPAKPGVPAKSNGQPQKPGELKTLTNALGTTRPLSSRERAILAMQGKLNK